MFEVLLEVIVPVRRRRAERRGVGGRVRASVHLVYISWRLGVGCDGDVRGMMMIRTAGRGGERRLRCRGGNVALVSVGQNLKCVEGGVNNRLVVEW